MKETQPSYSSQRTDPQEQQDMQDHYTSMETASHSKKSMTDLLSEYDPFDDCSHWVGKIK